MLTRRAEHELVGTVINVQEAGATPKVKVVNDLTPPVCHDQLRPGACYFGFGSLDRFDVSCLVLSIEHIVLEIIASEIFSGHYRFNRNGLRVALHRGEKAHDERNQLGIGVLVDLDGKVDVVHDSDPFGDDWVLQID